MVDLCKNIKRKEGESSCSKQGVNITLLGTDIILTKIRLRYLGYLTQYSWSASGVNHVDEIQLQDCKASVSSFL